MTAVLGRLGAVVVIAAALASCSGSVTAENPENLRARMTPAQVESLVLDQIHGMELTLGHRVAEAQVTRIVVRRGRTPDPGFDVVLWYVEARGTFVSNRGRGGLIGPSTTGTFQIDDADGTISAFGFPCCTGL